MSSTGSQNQEVRRVFTTTISVPVSIAAPDERGAQRALADIMSHICSVKPVHALHSEGIIRPPVSSPLVVVPFNTVSRSTRILLGLDDEMEAPASALTLTPAPAPCSPAPRPPINRSYDDSTTSNGICVRVNIG